MLKNNFLLKLAAKNVFRNKRRTLLTVIVIIISVGTLTFMFGYLKGVLGTVIVDSIKMTGHLRIRHPEYDLKERMLSLNVNVSNYKEIKDKISELDGIEAVSGRIKFGGLIDFNDNNEPGLGMGIESEAEKHLFNLEESIVSGSYFSGAPDETVIGKELANKLNLKPGDVLTVITRTAYNSMSAGNFKVVGIVDMIVGALNSIFYVPLENAQYLLDMEDKVSEIIIKGVEVDDAAAIKENLISFNIIGDEYKIQIWNEVGFLKAMLPILNRMYVILIGLFGLIASFSIINTMLMSVLERTREIGVLSAFGLRKYKTMFLFLIEAGIIGLTGGLLGGIIGGSFSYYLEVNGFTIGKIADNVGIPLRQTIYTDMEWYHIGVSVILGMLIAVFAAILPALKAAKTEPSKALRTY